MKAVFFGLLLIGCDASTFEFSTPDNLSCNLPVKITNVKVENIKGCWRITFQQHHGIVLYDPGVVSCNEGAKCAIVVNGESFWCVGSVEYDKNVWTAEDVDCSEVCP